MSVNKMDTYLILRISTASVVDDVDEAGLEHEREVDGVQRPGGRHGEAGQRHHRGQQHQRRRRHRQRVRVLAPRERVLRVRRLERQAERRPVRQFSGGAADIK